MVQDPSGFLASSFGTWNGSHTASCSDKTTGGPQRARFLPAVWTLRIAKRTAMASRRIVQMNGKSGARAMHVMHEALGALGVM